APRPSAARQEPKPKDPGPVLEVIVFHLIARRPERFDGQDMLRLLLENGLRYGDMHIFHRHRDVDGREQLEFSVANAVEPGTFDIDTMEDEQFAGITFFMKLPGPRDPLASLERMLTAGRRLAEGMNGDLKDEQHSVLTPQTMEHLRQRVQEFERRQRVSHGA
ncbi:MAG TPA: cell division protein ZipA, partial [Alcanivorax sp.]|nr:cell division protein ZipA [Alcanivorax sp.]HBP70143.1 cell division protein ZipA [Alcanivorax sp.]